MGWNETWVISTFQIKTTQISSRVLALFTVHFHISPIHCVVTQRSYVTDSPYVTQKLFVTYRPYLHNGQKMTVMLINKNVRKITMKDQSKKSIQCG